MNEPMGPHCKSESCSLLTVVAVADGAGCGVCADEGEALLVKSPTAPMKPGKELIRPHHLTHQPYRRWCTRCIMGKARDIRHNMERTLGDCNVISIGYMYLTGNKHDARPVLL